MKNYWCLFLLIPFLGSAQTEKISFNKKFTYLSAYEGSLVSMNLYYSPKNILIENPSIKKTTLFKNGTALPINLNLDNLAIYDSNNGYYDTEFASKIYQFEKLNEIDQISGYTCNYYKLSRQEGYYDMKWCIVEDAANDWLSFINNREKDIIKGFPVLAISEERTIYLLKSIQNTSESLTIDFQKEVEKEKKEKEKYTNVEEAAEVIVAPSTEYYDEDIYKTEFKGVEGEERYTNLAVDNLTKESPYWKGIPQYCTKLDEKVNVFTNKELRKHTRNYVGQLCDMYLSFVQEYGVDKKGTLDEIRHEENYFRNNKGNFSENDQKLLEEFITSLD